MNAEHALDYWQKKGLLGPKKAKELRKSLEEGIPHRAVGLFSTIGAILIGLGVILFVASNWEEMTPTLKVVILMTGMIATGVAGYILAFEREYEKTGMALLFVNVFLFGASIFLIGQIYHLPLDFWWGALLWFIGVAFFAYALRSRLHAWIAVPLLILFLGWLRTSLYALGRDEFDFLFNERYTLLSLLPLIGIGLMSVGILHRRSKLLGFASETYFHWGVFIVALPCVLATVEKSVLFNLFRLHGDPMTVITAVVAAACLLLALSRGVFHSSRGKAGLVGVAGFVALSYVFGYLPVWLGFPVDSLHWYSGEQFLSLDMATGLSVLYVLLAFFAMLLAVWFGTLLKDSALINIGIVGVAIIIFIQYFSWGYELLPRSLFFIVGGLVILIFSSFLEHKRRQLIASIHHA